MKSFFNFSSLVKTAFAAFVLLFVSNGLSAQTADVYNMTSCNQTVTLIDCAGDADIHSVPAIGPTPFAITHISGLAIHSITVTAGASCSYAPSPTMMLDISGCNCGGLSTFANGSYTSGGTTINGSAGCSGTPGNAVLIIN